MMFYNKQTKKERITRRILKSYQNLGVLSRKGEGFRTGRLSGKEVSFLFAFGMGTAGQQPGGCVRGRVFPAEQVGRTRCGRGQRGETLGRQTRRTKIRVQ